MILFLILLIYLLVLSIRTAVIVSKSSKARREWLG